MGGTPTNDDPFGEARTPKRALRVLVVDDLRKIVDGVVRLLRKHGVDADGAYSGEAALELLRATSPDLLICGVNMFEVSGFDVLRAARQLEPPVEVILFSGAGSDPMALEAVAGGAREFWMKPVAPGVMLDAIDVRCRELGLEPLVW